MKVPIPACVYCNDADEMCDRCDPPYQDPSYQNPSETVDLDKMVVYHRDPFGRIHLHEPDSLEDLMQEPPGPDK